MTHAASVSSPQDGRSPALCLASGSPRVLVACEYSARVRDAFRAQGCDAWSCDLEPCEGDPQWHIQGDVLDVIAGKTGQSPSNTWDLMIAHPPCTYLAASGMHWTVRGLRDPALTDRAADFFAMLYNAPIARKCIENPIGCMSKRLVAPTQKIQPWQFGDPESKLTCLWLVGLPPLVATHADGDLFAAGLPEREAHGKWRNQTASGQNNLRPGPDRWKERSRTYPGIARAMATQWAPLLANKADMPSGRE